MSWFLVIVLLSCTPNSLTLASNNIELPSTVVVGSVYCDTCFEAEFSKNSHFISGASVAVECQDGNSNPSFRKEVKTDRLGKFRVQLPFSVSKDANKIEGCSVKLVRSSEPNCALASTPTSSSLHLKARKQGAHIFSAGFFTFKPQKQPELCSQKPSVQNFKELSSRKTLIFPNIDPALPPLLQDPTAPGIPTIPGIPNLPSLPPQPQLPPLPPLTPGVPGIPSVPGKKQKVKKTESSKTTRFADNKNFHPETFFPTQELPPLPPVPGLPSLPPNPLLPPSTPGVLPPNPLQPPSIPGLLPPNPLLPPSVPGILPPNPLQPPSIPGLLPPNPLLPPSVPGILPPNPLQPPSTPGVLPPNPLLPPPNPGILPPVPLLPPPLLPPNPVLPPILMPSILAILSAKELALVIFTNDTS